ncbi:HNH endonuclease signature motif containing protein [Agrobacterium tomkonis]|uniref:HNH endonuclease signature motif containing protein n=1 Tax=Agrobacterium tomkonis TaxID=1183410 RepID=UPI001CD8DC5E
MRRGRIPYSTAELEWLHENFRMVISDYHQAFVQKFDRHDVSLVHLNHLRKRKGWRVGRDGSRYKGRLRTYSRAEMTWLEENRLLPISDYQKAFVETFGRDVSAKKLHALRKRQGWKTGRTGQFQKGQEPQNKGKTCAPGTGGRHPNAQRTHFKKGGFPHNTVGAGHERIDSKDGYVVLIVDEVNPWTGAKTRPVHKHRWLWEQANGPIPDDHVLKCLDGDKTNCDPLNWQLIPREVLPHLNGRYGLGFDQAEPEIKPIIMAVAKLKTAARQAKKRKAAC